MPTIADAMEAAWRHVRMGDLVQAERIYRPILESDPSLAEVWYRLGEVCQGQGKLAEAIAHYQKAVELGPQNAERLHHLGLAFTQQGRLDEAIAAFGQALQHSPDYVEAHFHLANALDSRGDAERAIASYEEVLRLRPDHAEALTNLGVVLAKRGRLEAAITNLRQALRLRPDLAKAHHNLGVALAERGDLEGSAASLRQALALVPDYAEAHYNLGNVLSDLGQRREAAASYTKAIEHRPDYAEAYNNLGWCLTELGQFRQATVVLKQAVRLRPDYVEAHNNLGLALAELGLFTEAEESYHRALAKDPLFADGHTNLGSTYKEQGRLEEAVACYQQAIWIKPDSASAHWNRALAWLQMGDFERGWPEYEWRWRRRHFSPRPFSQPLWDGSPLKGRTILIHTEQGLGDMLQFIRYAALAKERGGTVLVECPALLSRLFETCPGIDRVIPEGSDLPAFDVHAPLMSLPAIVLTTLATIPANIPYLASEPGRVDRWRQRLGPTDGMRLGIYWQGNPFHKWDRFRSIGLARWERLAHVEGVRLYSLQRGPGTEELAALGSRFSIVDLASGLEETPQAYPDLAAIMVNLDLVISVDTAAAHLAGALGVPIWVPLSRMVDWRWFLDREDSPWYPTMRLFRQRRLGEWDQVFERMAVELALLAAR